VNDFRTQLADKYRRMAALRASLPQKLDPASRTLLKALAREFPGALRELDSLPTGEIDQRLAALERGELAPWMGWMHRYHALMRAALHIKARPETAPETLGVDEAFARAVSAPAHGRLMVAVFERLSVETGVGRGALWDALFPPRKGARGYRHGP
jgi:hypothetical protein